MNNTAAFRWRKMNKKQTAAAETLLREREPWCVAACSRYLKHHSSKDAVWTLCSKDNSTRALIVYSNRTLLPVFCGRTDISEPGFLNGFFGLIPVHSVQGLVDEAIFLENYLSKCGLDAIDKIDYDLMYIDTLPRDTGYKTGLANLIIRSARRSDLDGLSVLQAGYEQEEVLPLGAEFHPVVSRLNMEKIFANEQLLVAELGGRIVGKINTSALSYTRFQVGGVYVLPAFRSRGIARRMTAEFISMLIKQGRGVSLFVKKANRAAQSVYKRLGFKFLADYRISYY